MAENNLDSTGTIQIEILQHLKPVIKYGFVLQGCLLFAIVPLFIFLGYTSWENEPIITILLFTSVIFTVIIANKYFANVFYKEYIILKNGNLSVVYKTGSKERVKTFVIKEILQLAYVGDQEFTPHPLDNDIIDFTGFGVAEREMQFLISDGTMEIRTKGGCFRFGKNTPSWEAERVISKIDEILGSSIKTKLQ